MNNLSSKGIYTNLNFSEVGITDGLVGWWPLNGNANDISGNANNGTVTGATVASGLNGLCYSFDGTGDYIITSAITIHSSMTWSVWYNSSNVANMFILDQRSSEVGVQPIYISSTGYIQFFDSTIGTSCQTSAGVALLNGTWHNIICSGTPSTRTIYYDGISVATLGTGITPQTARSIYIGSRHSLATYFNGSIDDVRIYNRALSAEEVTILYELGNSSNKTKISNNTTYIKGEFNELL